MTSILVAVGVEVGVGVIVCVLVGVGVAVAVAVGRGVCVLVADGRGVTEGTAVSVGLGRSCVAVRVFVGMGVTGWNDPSCVGLERASGV